MFFFGFPRVFLFFFGFGSSKTKKNLGNFCFFEFTVSSKREETKHYLGFFGFSRAKIQKTKKKPRDFCFFEFTLSSKRGKTKTFLGFYLVFEDPKPKKNKKTLGKPKKTSFDLKPKHSPQSFVFLVLVLVLEALGSQKQKNT